MRYTGRAPHTNSVCSPLCPALLTKWSSASPGNQSLTTRTSPGRRTKLPMFSFQQSPSKPTYSTMNAANPSSTAFAPFRSTSMTQFAIATEERPLAEAPQTPHLQSAKSTLTKSTQMKSSPASQRPRASVSSPPP